MLKKVIISCWLEPTCREKWNESVVQIKKNDQISLYDILAFYTGYLMQ